MQHAITVDTEEDRFPEHPVGVDALLKDVFLGLVDLWYCEARVAELQAEFLRTARLRARDRESLDLSA